MNDIQPLVTIQLAPAQFAPAQVVQSPWDNLALGGGALSGTPSGMTPPGSLLGGQIGGTNGLSALGTCPPLGTSSNPANSQGTSADFQNLGKQILGQFAAALENIVAAFRTILETILSRMQLGGSQTGTTTPASGSGTSTSASGGTTVPSTTSTAGTTGNTSSANPTTTSTTTPSTTTPSTGTPSTTTTGSSSTSTSGSTSPTTTSSSGASGSTGTGTTTAGARKLAKTGQFLWKPKAEKDGKLVILLPKKFGKAKAVRVLSPDGKTVLASGKFAGIANGDRAHYRFPKGGSEFPKGAIVEIVRHNGQKEQVAVPDPGKRFVY